MSDTSIATQAAFIAKYRGDTALQGLMIGASAPEWNIFDKGGAGIISPVFPYVYVHPITMTTGSTLTMGTDGNDIYMQVDVFTAQQGFDEARQIIARIYALTHGPVAGQFTLSTGVNVSTLFEHRDEVEETTDQLVQHIADRYKLMNQG